MYNYIVNAFKTAKNATQRQVNNYVHVEFDIAEPVCT